MKEVSKEKIQEWVDSINSYLQSRFDAEEEEGLNLIYAASGSLVEICKVFIGRGRFKDSFDTSKMYLNIFGIDILIKSEKIGVEFKFGFDQRGLVLSSPLQNFENVRHMPDDFYTDLVMLKSLGKIEFNQVEIAGKKYHPELYNNNKSLIYRILRHYVTDMMSDQDFMEFGDIEIYWEPEVDFNEIIEKASNAFKILYGMNYQLWKISDLKSKKPL